MIQVNQRLTKSRNPIEHGFRLENQTGSIIHRLPHDPYVLIRFDQFKIRKKIIENKKTKWIIAGIEWYLHEDDFIEKPSNQPEIKG